MARTTKAPWTIPYQVLPQSGPAARLDRRRAWRPSVLVGPGAVSHMWYSGDDGRVVRIVHAPHRLETGWRRLGPCIEAGFAGATDAGGVASPSVLRSDGTYLMAYTGSDGGRTRTHLALSVDGTRWEPLGPVPLDDAVSAGAADPCLVAVDGGLWLVQAVPGTDGRPGIHAAVRRDGGWEPHACLLAPRPDERGVDQPWLLAEDGGLTLFFTSHDAGGDQAIEVAASADGVTWERRDQPLDLHRRHHDRGRLGHPTATRLRGGDIRLWYSAEREGDTSGACRLWETDLLYGASP